MTTLTVGAGQQYRTIHDAVAASHNGDVVQVQAGTYVNDFTSIRDSIKLEAVGGGMVHVVATQSPPDGKAIFTVGAAGTDVTITGFEFSGAAVPDNNGAGIRYQGGALTLVNDYFHDNQDGLLANSDINGTITIRNSEFSHNGAGDGRSHNIYVNDVAQLTIDGSYFHDAVLGHEIKSRAENTTITNSRIFDNGGSASYSIDLPNGGNARISGNVIEQGPNSQNPAIIAYGEEGAIRAGKSLTINGNTILNHLGSGSARAVWNASGATAAISSNTIFGLAAGQIVSSGPASVTGSVFLSTEPTRDLSSPWRSNGSAATGSGSIGSGAGGSSGGGSGNSNSSGGSAGSSGGGGGGTNGSAGGADTLVVTVSEDAWRGDAQFIVSIDGKQAGGIQTATASHAAGQSQAITLKGDWGSGAHRVGVSFINDAWGGSASTDRNLYVNAVSYDGAVATATSGGGSATLGSNGTAYFDVAKTATTPSTSAGGGSSSGSSGTTAPVTSSLVLNVSEDAWRGDAQFIVKVDGRQMGGTYTATASHAAGKSQAVTITGIAESFSPHDIAVSFLNDAWGGSASTDRNLHVDSMQFDGRTVAGGTAALFWAGTQHFTATAPANWTGS